MRPSVAFALFVFAFALRFVFAFQWAETPYGPSPLLDASIYHAAWWDFVSYDPRLKGHELFIKRFLREELPVQEVETGVKRFLEELDEMMKKLEGMNGK